MDTLFEYSILLEKKILFIFKAFLNMENKKIFKIIKNIYSQNYTKKCSFITLHYVTLNKSKTKLIKTMFFKVVI